MPACGKQIKVACASIRLVPRTAPDAGLETNVLCGLWHKTQTDMDKGLSVTSERPLLHCWRGGMRGLRISFLS